MLLCTILIFELEQCSLLDDSSDAIVTNFGMKEVERRWKAE
jgi:hypothetical protein